MLLRGVALTLALSAGCGRVNFSDAGDAATHDARESASTDAPTICASWTARHFEPCALPSPLGPLLLAMPGEYTYDTSTNVLTDPGGGMSSPASLVVASGRVISVDAFTIASGVELKVVGARPLIVASWGDIRISGVIDATSTRTRVAAGANPGTCAAHAAAVGLSDNNGSSGGGGGAFAAVGGPGGGGSVGPGGVGGSAITAPLLDGGCAGGDGGRGGALSTVGTGGAGGGAVQLTARFTISIDGRVHAGGAGGGGAGGQSGGGGGGAGGMVGLEAQSATLAAAAILAANGGSGGGGSDSGAAGDDGVSGAPGSVRAAGGQGGDAGGGGSGGAGSGGATLTGGAGGDGGLNAGGGGGGSAGYVVIASPSITTNTATISPAYITP